jgi:Flp pilus assembly protein TadG
MSDAHVCRLRGLWSCAFARHKGLRDDSGSAVIELALVVALFGVLLLMGTSEMASVVYDAIEISNAAFAASAYGMQSLTYASNTSGMTSAARTEASDFGTALSVTPTTYYACSNAVGGTQYTGSNAQSDANAACTGTGNHALEFVQVTTSATVTPPIHCPGLAASFVLTGFSVMEVEQ